MHSTESEGDMDLFDVMHTQRAMRRLEPDPIPDDVLRRLLEAAVCAPSGGNRQGWRFIVVRDAAIRTRLGAIYRACFHQLLERPYYRAAAQAPPDSPAGRLMASALHLADHLGEAPVLVVACVDADGQAPSLTLGASIYPAVQNLLLAARALGIGSTLTTVHRFREAEVKALLGVPDGVETAALIPLGYPRGRFGRPRRRPAAEVTNADRWGQPIGW